MEVRKRKRKETIEIEVGKKIVIRSRDFVLEYDPTTGIKYTGSLIRVNRAIELLHLLKNEMGLEQYRIGDAIHIEEGQEVEPENQPIS
ncbi:MAG: hypothetical protein C0177_00765 [Fervidicoccus fontis]|nr:MAG: hypothetical protein C0177_00765 [Fervidicoccus fontis]